MNHNNNAKRNTTSGKRQEFVAIAELSFSSNIYFDTSLCNDLFVICIAFDRTVLIASDPRRRQFNTASVLFSD